jgi:predicted metal-binding transcription factor (methanogenesis marker protein 9)
MKKDIFCNIFRGSLFYCCKVTKFPVPMKVRLNGSNLSTVNFYLYYGYKNGLLEYLGFVTNFEIQSKGENRFFFTAARNTL